MKRIIALLVLICMLLSGCSFFEERMLDSVTFYYLQTEYAYGKNPSVIVSETREAAGHRDDLSYLLALYLMGPAEEEHRSPLPPGTRILKSEQKGTKITLELTNPFYSYADAELTLACACLTMTCLDITDAEEVTVIFGEQEITMSRSSLTLLDDSKTNTALEETK